MMTQERFEALADAYGGDMARWPEAERENAKQYAEAHPDLTKPVLRNAAMLDAALTGAAEAPPSDTVFQSIVASGVSARRPKAPSWAAAAAAVMLAVGMGAGWFAAPEAASIDDAVFASAFGALEDVDLFELEDA